MERALSLALNRVSVDIPYTMLDLKAKSIREKEKKVRIFSMYKTTQVLQQHVILFSIDDISSVYTAVLGFRYRMNCWLNRDNTIDGKE